MIADAAKARFRQRLGRDARVAVGGDDQVRAVGDMLVRDEVRIGMDNDLDAQRRARQRQPVVRRDRHDARDDNILHVDQRLEHLLAEIAGADNRDLHG